MHKSAEQRKQERFLEEQKRKRRNTRNMIIAVVSLALAVFCYYFLDGILETL